MVLQSVVFRCDPCPDPALCLRSRQGKIALALDGRSVRIPPGEELDTYTYMNLFDAGLWGRLSGISSYVCRVELTGKAVIRLWKTTAGMRYLLKEQEVDSTEPAEIRIPFENHTGGHITFTILAETEVVLSGAAYEADCPSAPVHISLVICTYKRQEALRHILDVLRGSRFFRSETSHYGNLSIRVVDNGEEMAKQQEELLKVYPNRNEGGSGGFRRGMQESRREEKEYGITHVVLMDDDVDIVPETFYRLYALLSVMKTEYRQQVIAGRMFRTDRPQVQYTAAEIWNQGDIRHVGYQKDMTDPVSLDDVNLCNGEYSGWWLACFPMEYVQKNDPLPFFLHCDDVEYGLRHGGTPIILNGVQVWHETADHRQNSRINYYDTRNSMIVNHLQGMPQEEICRRWFQRISWFHVQGETLSEYMAIRAMEDYLKGLTWLEKIDGRLLNDELSHITSGKWMRYSNAIRWRRIMRRSQKVRPDYWMKKCE